MTQGSAQPLDAPRRGLRNFTLQLASDMVAQAIAFGLAIYLARILGAHGFGLWVFAATIITYLAVVIDGGTETWGMREVGGHPERLKQALIGVVRLRLALCAATLFVVGVTAIFVPREQSVALLFGTSSLLVLVFNTNWAHRGLELAAPSLTTLIQRLIMAALVVIMVRSPSDAAQVTLWQGLSEGIAAMILLAMLARRLRAGSEATDPPPHRRLFQEAWPLGVSRALRNLATAAGAVVLGFTSSTDDVGYFGAALRIATIIVLLSTIFNNVAFPALTRASKIGGKAEAQSIAAATRLLALLVTPVVVGGLVLSGPIIHELFTPNFSPAALPLAILLVALFCMAHGDLMRRILAARHHQRLDLKLTARATALTMVAIVALTPFFAILGAASAMLVGEFALLILAKRALAQTGPGISVVKASAVPFVAALLMAAGVFLLSDYSVWVRLAAGAIIYSLLMWLDRARILDDLHTLAFLAKPAPPSKS